MVYTRPVLRLSARCWALGAVLVAACEPDRPPARRPYVLPPEIVDAGPDDARVRERLCALRATPSMDLSVGSGHGRAALAWSGTTFGVAWMQVENNDARLGFVRVSPTGERLGAPSRVTDRGFRPSSPALFWNGVSWSLLFEGGYRAERGDLYQTRVDARGNPVGTPWRMTRGDRDDSEPGIVARPQGGLGLTWIGREAHGGRTVLYGQLLDRFDAPRSLAVRMLDTSLTLTAPKVTWADGQWVFTCLSSRGEVMAVDFSRLDDRGLPTGSLRHASPDRIGGVDTAARYDIAWGGSSFGVVWSELREGATQVYFRNVSARGNALGEDVCVSEGAPTASEPTIVRVRDGVFAVAMRVERDGIPRVWVRTVDAGGTFQRGRVELQGADGSAALPVAMPIDDDLAVVTSSVRGVAFHRVNLGPCVSP